MMRKGAGGFSRRSVGGAMETGSMRGPMGLGDVEGLETSLEGGAV